MSPVIHCCVFLVFVTQFISAEPLWTKSQMEYLENMKQDYRQEIGKNKMRSIHTLPSVFFIFVRDTE